MNYILRKPTESDIPRIVEMDRAVADHLHSVDEYWKKGADIGGNDRISEMVRRAISSADESWLVAESDGKLVGFFSAEIMPAIPVFEP